MRECSHPQIATFVAGRLKLFVVNRFGEVGIGHLCKFLYGHDLLLQNRLTVLEIMKDADIRQNKNQNVIRIKTHQFHEATH
jgi:hypothetical protein